MKKVSVIISMLIFCSGCATYEMSKPIGSDTASPITIKEAVISGILMAHPELTRKEAEGYAKVYYLDNKVSIDAMVNRIGAGVDLANFIAALLRVQGGTAYKGDRQ